MKAAKDIKEIQLHNCKYTALIKNGAAAHYFNFNILIDLTF